MKKWIMLSAMLVETTCFASVGSHMGNCCCPHDGLYLGVGAAYNSINLTQNTWGEGISNITTNTGTNSNGIGDGSGAPFHNITNMFSPAFQLGYFGHFSNQNLVGFKFLYQYLGAAATNPNLYIPQLGTTTSDAGVTSPLYGYVNADSVQVFSNHQLTFLAILGQSIGNSYFYFGAGPALFNLHSKNYYSIGYADYNGATLNITGLVSYSSPSMWLLGGAAQLGMTYFITPTLFLDFAYTYAATASKTSSYQQPFTNTSTLGDVTYTTSGTLFTKNTLRISNQSAMLTINKILD